MVKLKGIIVMEIKSESVTKIQSFIKLHPEEQN